ncbi:DUF882 domain-containing protein [Breoghania sp. L-A4]|uniref:DUF882 domain-containing protein n=1 Tax=Breoghania sp. L-A4 TaxID=2304600 RepID=UPI0020C0760D|nr:DUF882 domain-containing protein [Breoghania sp. L-A4]
MIKAGVRAAACLRSLAVVAAGAIVLSAAYAGAAEASSRALRLYNTHTGERAEITFKKNGRFVDGGLRELNQFLRDWRRNEPTKMDPELFDLIWDVYQKSGSKDYIHVVSGYRSPATNNMLRGRSRGVAKFSQHMRGKAMDFFLPDVSISTLRKLGLQKEIGGVGYYPKSNSPFVHMDTGSVRHWPRMTRKQLASVFPDGKTVHVPSDGKPMPGYKQAQAALKRRERDGGQQIVVASAAPTPTARIRGGDNQAIRPVPVSRSNTGKGFIASLFSGNSSNDGPTPPAALGRAPGAIAAVVPTSIRPPQKPDDLPGVSGDDEPEEAPVEANESSAEEVPILVAALPLAKPRPIAAEPTVLAALPMPAPSNPHDAISALTDAETPRAAKPDTIAPGAALAYASAIPRPLPPTFSGARAADDKPAKQPIVLASLQGTRTDETELRAFSPPRRSADDLPQPSITGSFPRGRIRSRDSRLCRVATSRVCCRARAPRGRRRLPISGIPISAV